MVQAARPGGPTGTGVESDPASAQTSWRHPTGPPPVGVEPPSVADTWTLPAALDAEIDEVLSMLPLVAAGMDVGDRVFSRLVEHLAQAVLHDVRVRHERGDMTRSEYMTEMCQLVVTLQDHGLLGDGLPPSP